MINGILELKSNALAIVVSGFLICSGCKEHAKDPITDTPVAETQTNIRFATKMDNYKEKTSFNRLTTGQTEITSTQFQMEGPAWENDHVAFRNYFDTRNGIDIFGKKTIKMVLDSVGINENYHELQDWGMDILKVGNSLGAGAIGMIINDSLYRVGGDVEGSFSIIDETPSSSTLEFVFKNWKIQGRTYTVLHTINIKADTHFYEANIEVQGMIGDETLVTGIVDHDVSTSTLNTDKYTVISTHGNQDVEGLMLGMAIAVVNNDFQKNDIAANYKGNVDKTHLVLLNGNDVSYKFFAGWELENENFKSKEQFEKMILAELEI